MSHRKRDCELFADTADAALSLFSPTALARQSYCLGQLADESFEALPSDLRSSVRDYEKWRRQLEKVLTNGWDHGFIDRSLNERSLNMEAKMEKKEEKKEETKTLSLDVHELELLSQALLGQQLFHAVLYPSAEWTDSKSTEENERKDLFSPAEFVRRGRPSISNREGSRGPALVDLPRSRSRGSLMKQHQ